MYLIVLNMTGMEIDINDIEKELKSTLNIIRINGKCDNREAESVYDTLCSFLYHYGCSIEWFASEIMFPVVIKHSDSVSYLRSYGSIRRYIRNLGLKSNNLNWFTVYDVDM